MQSVLLITCAETRVFLASAVCSRNPVLKIRDSLTGQRQRFATARFAYTCSASRKNGGLRCWRSGWDWRRTVCEDFANANWPKGEEEGDVNDTVRDEDVSLANSEAEVEAENVDPISDIVTGGWSTDNANTLAECELSCSKGGRLEELCQVMESVSVGLVSVLGELAGAEDPNGMGKDCQGTDEVDQPAGRSGESVPVMRIGTSIRGIASSEVDTVPFRKMDFQNDLLKNDPQNNDPEVRGVNGTFRNRKGALTGESVEKVDRSIIKDEDERLMREALAEAKKAALDGEVPVGAVIVQQGRIIARAYNRVETEGDPTAHAEIMCIRNAAKSLGDWRLMEATLYVTLEPCPMCAGAILQSRLKEVVWGARNTLLGADGSWVSLFPDGEDEDLVGDYVKPENEPRIHPFHTNLQVRRGVLAEDCSDVMRGFFQGRRKGKAAPSKKKPQWLPLSAWLLLKRLMHFWASLNP